MVGAILLVSAVILGALAGGVVVQRLAKNRLYDTTENRRFTRQGRLTYP